MSLIIPWLKNVKDDDEELKYLTFDERAKIAEDRITRILEQTDIPYDEGGRVEQELTEEEDFKPTQFRGGFIEEPVGEEITSDTGEKNEGDREREPSSFSKIISGITGFFVSYYIFFSIIGILLFLGLISYLIYYFNKDRKK